MIPDRNISHYEITEKLGEGGMGVVYKAWDHKLKRPVALKFLAAHLAVSEAQVARFHQEAHAISALNHPNIATIYEIDEAQGHSFLALEYLPGGTLKSALDQLQAAGRQLSLEQGLDYALQIADALAHAHSHGVIHRDIKAGNALFTESGTLKLTDFGLAKLAEGSVVTQTQAVMGTPATMSPEQAQGLETDARSDIFSAGVVMFEMFTGQLPFRGANAVAVLHQVVHAPAPPLSNLRPGIPIALEHIVSRTLEKDLARRYQSAAELAADMRALRRELLIASSTGRSALETVALGTAAIPPAPSRRRRSWPLGLAAACVGLGIVWVGGPAVLDRTEAAFRWLRGRSLPSEKRLAILPFRNVGGDPRNQAFVDGLREVVIGKLTRVEGSLVVVVSPDEVREKDIATPAEALKRLGANLVMTGSVLQAGQQPQVIVNLEDPQTLTVLRSETLDASRPDLTAEAAKVVRMLDLEMNAGARQDLQSGDSPSPDATRYYIEGRGYMLRPDRLENLDLASNAFRDALAKDPNYALARAGLADALRWKYSFQKDAALLDEAETQAGQALERNGRTAAIHVVMGEVHHARGNEPAAEQEFQAALKLEPPNARAFRGLAEVYEATHRDKDAEATYRKAIEARPGDATTHLSLGRFYYNRERFSESELSFRRAIDLTPDSYRAHMSLGAVYLQMQRDADAVDQFEKSVSIEPNTGAYSNLGVAHYRLKHYTEAALAYQRAVDMVRTNSAYWGNLADAYRWAPELHDKAPEAYRRAIELLEGEVRTNSRDARLRARLAMYYASVYALGGSQRQPGDRRRALEEMANSLMLDSSSAYVQFRAALVYEQVGDRERALKALQLALDAGEPRAEVLTSPPLEALRKDPRFARMASPRP